jgi:hypothetical protein
VLVLLLIIFIAYSLFVTSKYCRGHYFFFSQDSLEFILDARNDDRFFLAADTKEVEKAIETKRPKNFTVGSPRHQTKHFYFYRKIASLLSLNSLLKAILAAT